MVIFARCMGWDSFCFREIQLNSSACLKSELHCITKACLWSTENTESHNPSLSTFFFFCLSFCHSFPLLLPPSFFISKIIKCCPFTGTNPQRRINYFTSGTELSHCEQHIAGINAHQLAKLCAFSKWVAGFWGNRNSRRPLRDCSLAKLVGFRAYFSRRVMPVEDSSFHFISELFPCWDISDLEAETNSASKKEIFFYHGKLCDSYISGILEKSEDRLNFRKLHPNFSLQSIQTFLKAEAFFHRFSCELLISQINLLESAESFCLIFDSTVTSRAQKMHPTVEI